MAALEQVTRAALVERHPAGVRLTDAGRVLLRHAAVVLDELDAAGRELSGLPPEGGAVRLGAFASAGAVLLPRALAALRRSHPRVEVSTREASTPALVRGLRAGSLDLTVLALSPPFRPPDAETPSLVLETLAESELLVAVPPGHPLTHTDRGSIRLADLRGQAWIASRSTGDETLLGVWPGLDERARIAHSTRDWLAKLQLVAAGCGLTSVPALLAPVVPAGVRLLRVADGPKETRRLVLGRRPGPLTAPANRLREALHEALHNLTSEGT
jgi:DNA-binding transcriptional LysR family regulator